MGYQLPYQWYRIGTHKLPPKATIADLRDSIDAYYPISYPWRICIDDVAVDFPPDRLLSDLTIAKNSYIDLQPHRGDGGEGCAIMWINHFTGKINDAVEDQSQQMRTCTRIGKDVERSLKLRDLRLQYLNLPGMHISVDKRKFFRTQRLKAAKEDALYDKQCQAEMLVVESVTLGVLQYYLPQELANIILQLVP
jgi:hypothetical protein